MFATVLIIAASSLLQVVSAAATTTGAPAKCYEKARDYYPYFSTRTAYENVHGHVTRLENSCIPAQVWMLSRHGTRYPGMTVMPSMLNMTTLRDQILQNHEQGAGLLCSNELEKLRNWQLEPKLNMQKADMLADQGEDDLRELAKRLKEVFADLFDPKNAKPGDFVFRATDTQRAQASLKAFYHGLFENDESIAQPEVPPANDTLLWTHNFCPAWKTSYDTDQVNAEHDKFTVGPEFRNVLQNVGRRLGFSQELDIPTIESIYETCRFETAWHPNRTSTWCLMFRGDELKVLEYREDLDYYYFCGPGRPMSAKIGCQTLSDMFKHFKALETGNFSNQPKGVFYFAHTVTLQTLMAALRITEDSQPLLASNYAETQDRHFRTSLLGPFTSNVIAVFYRCSSTKTPYKVTIYVAEKLVKIPGCQDGLCDWDFLKKKFNPDIEKCSMDFCYENLTASAATPVSSVKLIIMMIIEFSIRLLTSSNIFHFFMYN